MNLYSYNGKIYRAHTIENLLKRLPRTYIDETGKKIKLKSEDIIKKILIIDKEGI